MRFIVLFLIAACGGPGDSIDRHIEPAITIGHGLYGQLTQQSDVAGSPPTVFAAVPIAAFEKASGRKTATTSDNNGVYQLQLAAGTYTVCTNNCPADNGPSNPGCCTQLGVPDGLVRQDWESNLSGGWWCEGACPD